MFSSPAFRLEILDECSSTNDLLLQRRENPDFPGQALLAKRQTAGFGRRGKDWWSGSGNLALSLAFRLKASAPPPTLLTFVAGLALVEVLKPLLPASAKLQLKWPNDIYLNGKKLSGMIAQARQSEQGSDVVLGIGLNLVAAPPGMEAISLAEITTPPEAKDFAEKFLKQFQQKLSATKEFESLRNQWEKAARLQETRMTIVGEGGIFQGLRLLPTGELEVEDRNGNRRVLSSETVSLRLA